MAKTTDVIVIGAGTVGCSVAYALARNGTKVTVLERGEIAREASWAAGGILTPIRPHAYPPGLVSLCAKGREVYDRWVPDLEEETGIDPEYEKLGMILLVRDDEDDEEAAAFQKGREQMGEPVEELSAEEVRSRVPGLHPEFRRAFSFPEVWQIRNPRFNRALAAAAEKRGATFRTRTPVTRILREGSRVIGVRSRDEEIHGGTVVVAAGAWSADPALGFGSAIPVKPIRGQMILTDQDPVAIRQMLLWKGKYLIPRRDGKILIGSTVEDVGFESRVTARGVGDLLQVAAEMVPGLADRPFLQAWAGLRPSTPTNLPHIGPIPEAEGAIAATGHYRVGIILGPLTGELIQKKGTVTFS